MEDRIDFSFIPLTSDGRRRWVECNNTPIPFKYKGVGGTIYVTHTGKNSTLKARYNKREKLISHTNLTRGFIGGIVFDTSHSYSVGTVINGGIIKKQIKINTGKWNKKGYLMECLYTGLEYHVDEHHLKEGNFNPYLNGKRVWWGNCLYTQKHLLKYIKNVEETKKYHRKSSKKILCKCPLCGSEKYIIIKNLVKQGFGCDRCSKIRSFPERVMGSILTLNNIPFINEYTFNNLKGRRFDFYLPKHNTIIETHGLQHYEKVDYFKYDVKTSDKEKENYCVNNGINLIIVDSRKSDLSFIINNIKDIDFFKDFNIEEKDVMIEMECNYGK
ncbi:homing endonuclease [Staphylococcus phage vB_SepS_SEP9]|uniref:Homing endonuclease n=1 Tax=Staphylococcus phage vB_SepS_SEP9 TaxID=1434319 RepID=W5RV99_9CAUD|nr:homing endonuclease [Staphylococcus phage vB_SepS_SEP9]AHG23992.1 homing endonuclease [Staphylococcus phage vB_SepS_SEP9]